MTKRPWFAFGIFATGARGVRKMPALCSRIKFSFSWIFTELAADRHPGRRSRSDLMPRRSLLACLTPLCSIFPVGRPLPPELPTLLNSTGSPSTGTSQATPTNEMHSYPSWLAVRPGHLLRRQLHTPNKPHISALTFSQPRRSIDTLSLLEMIPCI